eukprot:5056895-Amphidinium_carterae.2
MLLREDLSDIPLELLTDCVNLETIVDQQILESLASSKRVLKMLYAGSFSRVAAKLRQRSYKAATKTIKYLDSTPPSLPETISSLMDTEFWRKSTTPCIVSVPWYSTKVVRPLHSDTSQPFVKTSLQSTVQQACQEWGHLSQT